MRSLMTMKLVAALLFLVVAVIGPLRLAAADSAGTWETLRVYQAPVSVGLLSASLIGAHLLAPESYVWTRNTISDLGAQGYENAWLTRSAFVGFGGLTAAASVLDLAEKTRTWPEAVPLMVYGLSVMLTGFFSAPPFVEGVPYSESEARLHSTFAALAGVSISASMLAGTLVDGHTPAERWISGSALGLTVLNSVLFALNEDDQGIWQRILWAVGLGWIACAS